MALKEHKTILIPTEAYLSDGLCKRRDDGTVLRYPESEEDHKQAEYQHIYILSDNDIGRGDIVKAPCSIGRVKELHWKYGNDNPSYIVEDIVIISLRYGQTEGELQTNSFRSENCKKIIACNNPNLNWKRSKNEIQAPIEDVPRLTNEFMNDWVAEGCPEMIYVEESVEVVVPNPMGRPFYEGYTIIREIKVSPDNTIACSLIPRVEVSETINQDIIDFRHELIDRLCSDSYNFGRIYNNGHINVMTEERKKVLNDVLVMFNIHFSTRGYDLG